MSFRPRRRNVLYQSTNAITRMSRKRPTNTMYRSSVMTLSCLFGVVMLCMIMFDSRFIFQWTDNAQSTIVTHSKSDDPKQSRKLPSSININRRTSTPMRCTNSSHRLFPITPSDHNWAPHYFRCNDLHHEHYAVKPWWIKEAVISKELFYVHVFKGMDLWCCEWPKSVLTKIWECKLEPIRITRSIAVTNAFSVTI